MQNQRENKYFRSSDFYLCCYLFAKGAVIAGLDKTNPKRAVFSFETSSELEQLVEDYWQNKAVVNPAVFVYAIKELKQQLHSDNFL